MGPVAEVDMEDKLTEAEDAEDDEVVFVEEEEMLSSLFRVGGGPAPAW